jgi:hypothetical protein
MAANIPTTLKIKTSISAMTTIRRPRPFCLAMPYQPATIDVLLIEIDLHAKTG